MDNYIETKVMVAGHICLDIAPRIPQSLTGGFAENFVPGKLINVDEVVLGTGGAVSNTGLAMARLGVDVLLNGKVGNDEFGMIIKQLVGEERAASFRTVADRAHPILSFWLHRVSTGYFCIIPAPTIRLEWMILIMTL